jgi:hypothetical protein
MTAAALSSIMVDLYLVVPCFRSAMLTRLLTTLELRIVCPLHPAHQCGTVALSHLRHRNHRRLGGGPKLSHLHRLWHPLYGNRNPTSPQGLANLRTSVDVRTGRSRPVAAVNIHPLTNCHRLLHGGSMRCLRSLQ